MAAGEIPGEILTSVAATNFKVVAEAPAYYTQLAFGDAVAHQRGMNAVREAAIAAAVKGLTELDAAEAASISKVTTGNDLAAQIAQLLAAVAGNGQMAKVVYTTPPSNEK